MSIRYLDEAPATAELVVAGGGVVGAATAFHAARAGLRPLIVEARPRLCTLTTSVAAGAFRLQFDDLEELELVRESVAMFLAFEEATGQSEFRLRVARRGYLWLTTDDATAERQRSLVERLHAWGQSDVDLVVGEEVRHRWPWVTPDVIQARWRADDGFLDTKGLTFGLAAGADADVLTSSPVTGFKVVGDRLAAVETENGSIACGAAVICCGPLSGTVADLAGVDLTIVTVPRQKLIMPHVPEVPADGPMVIDEDTGAHWRPAHDHGAWLLFTDPTTAPTEPTMDVSTDHRFAFRLLDPASPVAVARTVPFWRDVWERGVDHWMLQAGQYTVTPDYRPLIGFTEVEGLFVNTGYSGHGIMLGPAGGRICVEAIADGRPGPFDPREPRSVRQQPTL
jgi:glycine/D-amino acid oxidase-like deaminating enzyme